MLQTIRDRAHGWIAWVIVFLISVPFALWGIQSYLDIGGEPVAARVNGVEIPERELDRRVQVARIQLHERLGAAFDAAQLDDRRLREEVLSQIVRETLLTDVSRQMGLGVSATELRVQILAEPAFQRDGRFDKGTYEQALKLQGMSPAMFEQQLRQRIVGTQMIRAVVGSELVTAAEESELQRLLGQRREVAWLRIPAARFESEGAVTDAEIQAYYESNPGRFEIPEQVKLDYLILDVATLAAKGETSEDELKSAYESQQAKFGQPERRQVRHILLTVPPGADEAKAQAVAAELKQVRSRIEGGEPFAEVAKSVSQDPGSKSQGGDLGEIERGIMDPAFDEAAFAQEAGRVGEPVRTRFGWHLILVESVVPARVKPFGEVREELRAEIARQKAESLFYDLGERLANVVYEHPDSLEPAAQELGLAVQHSDWVPRQGGEGVLGHPKVTAAAFSEEVLNERKNSDLIEPEKEVLQAVALRVVDHREAAAKPLAEVREEILATLREEKGRRAAAEAAAAAAERLRGGADWAELGGEGKVEGPALVDRQDPKLPPPVRTAAFALPVPGEGKASVGTATFDDGDAAVLRLTKVEDAPAKPQPQGREGSALTRSLGRQSYESVLSDMERRASIERKAASQIPEG
jgi:peptidyl-prolyl cis-trans isomerase D